MNRTMEVLARALMETMEASNNLPPEGTPISLSEAARKYEIHFMTLHRWLKRGWIKTLQAPVTGGAPRFVDERDVCKLTRLFKQSGARPGSHVLEKIFKKSELATVQN